MAPERRIKAGGAVYLCISTNSTERETGGIPGVPANQNLLGEFIDISDDVT